MHFVYFPRTSDGSASPSNISVRVQNPGSVEPCTYEYPVSPRSVMSVDCCEGFVKSVICEAGA